jgi:hypothetical protein
LLICGRDISLDSDLGSWGGNVSLSIDSKVISADELVRALRFAAASAQKLPPAKALDAVGAAPFGTQAQKAKRTANQMVYGLAFTACFLASMSGIWFANQAYGPEMYGQNGMVAAADAHAEGKNYSVFDLNLNIRALRDEQLKRMTKTPEVIILGASHWQEAHKDQLRGMDVFNAHIHRDYWEDPLGMVELLVSHNKLPKKLIISIRDRQFTPVEVRKDWLWEPGIPAYRAMTQRLGIEPESYWKTAPYHRLQALISLPMLFENFTRWYNAPEHPGPTTATRAESMDMVLPDGSIMWSNKKMHIFTPERTREEVKKYAQVALANPPVIDPKGVAAFETLFSFLKKQGVQVYLTNPPFNPAFYDQIEGTPYAEGLARVEALTQKFSKEFNFPIFGGFNPHKMGCTAEMYIDAEHSNPQCLQSVFDQFLALDGVRKSN